MSPYQRTFLKQMSECLLHDLMSSFRFAGCVVTGVLVLQFTGNVLLDYAANKQPTKPSGIVCGHGLCVQILPKP